MSCLKNLEETGGFSNLIVTNQFRKRSGRAGQSSVNGTEVFEN